MELIEYYGNPIIKFIPGPPIADEDKAIVKHDLPKECAIFKIDDNYIGGLIVYSRYGEKWHANNGERWVIRHLLKLN